MENTTLQNKNLQKDQHELIIFSNLKELANCYVYSTNEKKSYSLLQSNTESSFLSCKKKNEKLSFYSINKEKIKKNLIKKSTDFQWFRYFLSHKPINLLFSIDQFLFEFAKKQPQRRKSSEFQQQLKERKKLTLFYGHLSKKQLQNLVFQSKSHQGYFSKNFFSLIERRLDVLLYRSGLVKNIITARQVISHKKITVNNQIVNTASFQVSPGDIISIVPKKKSTEFSETLLAKFKKRRSRSTISQNFLYKLENIKNFKNNNQKKTLKNSIRLLLTKIENRAHLKSLYFEKNKINKSCLFPKQKNSNNFLNLIDKSKTNSFLPSLQKLNRNIFNNKANNFTLLKFKPLFSKQAKSFVLIYIQKNYLSLDRKLVFQNKYTRFKDLLEKNVYSIGSFLESKNKRHFSTKDQQSVNHGVFDKQKNNFPLSFQNKNQSKNKIKNTLKTFAKKLSTSSIHINSKVNKTSIQKNPFLNSSSSFVKKRILAVYRNIVYKTLLQMHTYFLYSGNKENKIIKSLLTLKLKKHRTKKHSRKHILKSLRFAGIRPLHLEVSYSLSTVILLFSPQRLSFPFYVDVDLLLRSFN